MERLRQRFFGCQRIPNKMDVSCVAYWLPQTTCHAQMFMPFLCSPFFSQPPSIRKQPSNTQRAKSFHKFCGKSICFFWIRRNVVRTFGVNECLQIMDAIHTLMHVQGPRKHERLRPCCCCKKKRLKFADVHGANNLLAAMTNFLRQSNLFGGFRFWLLCLTASIEHAPCVPIATECHQKTTIRNGTVLAGSASPCVRVTKRNLSACERRAA